MCLYLITKGLKTNCWYIVKKQNLKIVRTDFKAALKLCIDNRQTGAKLSVWGNLIGTTEPVQSATEKKIKINRGNLLMGVWPWCTSKKTVQKKVQPQLPVWKFIWIRVIAERWRPTSNLRSEQRQRGNRLSAPDQTRVSNPVCCCILPVITFFPQSRDWTEKRKRETKSLLQHSQCMFPQAITQVSSKTGGSPDMMWLQESSSEVQLFS